MFIWENHHPSHRDLACQQARSRYTGKPFVSYERSVTFHFIFIQRRDLACRKVFSLTEITFAHMNRPQIILYYYTVTIIIFSPVKLWRDQLTYSPSPLLTKRSPLPYYYTYYKHFSEVSFHCDSNCDPYVC